MADVQPDRVKPERRTRADLIVTALITALVLLAGVLLWWTSPARTTESVTASTDPVPQLPTESLPETLKELWRAPSGATAVPAVSRATIVSADGGTVIGHDPATGAQRWRYQRQADLCAAVAAWPGGDNRVLAVYRNSRGCSEVTALDAGSGARKGNRTSDADDQITLSYDQAYALAAGDTRLETWGTNLVRGIEYGRVDAPVNPDVQPDRTECRLLSAVGGGNRVAVIERCARDRGYRLTVLGSTLDKDEKITQYGSAEITDNALAAPPVVIATTDSTVTVYDGRGPAIRLFGTDAKQRTTHPVQGEEAPPVDSLPLTSTGLVTYWTGSSTVVVDANSGEPTVQIVDTIGPGEMGTGLLIPVRDAVSVRDPVDGRELRRIPVDRGTYTGMVSLRVLGTQVIEQRGDQIVVLGSGR